MVLSEASKSQSIRLTQLLRLHIKPFLNLFSTCTNCDLVCRLENFNAVLSRSANAKLYIVNFSVACMKKFARNCVCKQKSKSSQTLEVVSYESTKSVEQWNFSCKTFDCRFETLVGNKKNFQILFLIVSPRGFECIVLWLPNMSVRFKENKNAALVGSCDKEKSTIIYTGSYRL